MAHGTLDAAMSKLADVYYPVGHYLVTTTNTNPNNLGIKGTWELKSKTLSRQLNNLIGTDGSVGDFFTPNSTNFTLSGLRIRSDGSTIYLNFWGYNKVALNDTAVTVGSFDLSLLGDNITGYWSYVHGQVNSNKVIFAITCDTTSQIINVTDIITNTSGTTSFAAQSSAYLYFHIPFHITTNTLTFNDNICSGFHWLRTA